jgi:hypothetical protein
MLMQKFPISRIACVLVSLMLSASFLYHAMGIIMQAVGRPVNILLGIQGWSNAWVVEMGLV